jgi:hypothetical protein
MCIWWFDPFLVVLCCSWLFNGFFFDVFSFPWVSLVRGRGCSGGSGTRVEGVGLFRLARGRWYGASAQSRHAVELRGRGRTSFVCVIGLSCRLVFLGRGAAAPKWSWSQGLFRPMDWLAGGPGGSSMARWKQADESLLRFFVCVSLSWSLGESFLIFRENEYCWSIYKSALAGSPGATAWRLRARHCGVRAGCRLPFFLDFSIFNLLIYLQEHYDYDLI